MSDLDLKAIRQHAVQALVDGGESHPSQTIALVDALIEARSQHKDLQQAVPPRLIDLVRAITPETVAALKSAAAWYVSSWYERTRTGEAAELADSSPVKRLLDALETVAVGRRSSAEVVL